MRTLRFTAAAVVCVLALLGTAGHAGAGDSPVSASMTAVCDPDSGTYEVTLTVGAFRDVTLDIGRFYAYDTNDDEITKGVLNFDPTEIGPGTDSVVVFSVPGNTALVEAQVDTIAAGGTDAFLDLTEPCSTAPTTPEAPTTTEPPTTAAPAAAAAVASPRFTG